MRAMSSTVDAGQTSSRPASSPPESGSSVDATRRHASRFGRLSLAQRFLLANLAILLVAGLAVGLWIGNQLERSIVDRTASVTALYVESIIEPSVASLRDGGELTPAEVETLDGHLASSALADRVRSLRLWSREGEVIYSPYPKLIGQRFPVDGHLAEAWAGEVVTEMDDLSGEENEWERQYWDRLLEMYIPVRERGTENIIAVAEFYLPPRDIDDQVAQARLTAWGLVTTAIVLAGLLLWRVVKRGSDTIQRQEAVLSRQVDELTEVLAENAELNERVHYAAERTTTLNERAMRRVSSDLHDGPGQMLSLAMLRLDRFQQRAADGDPPSADELAEVESVLQEAMADMRSVAAGLRLPELASMTAEEVALRAVADHERRSPTRVELDAQDLPDGSPLPVRIALFRALQESLSNATRHGGVDLVRVRLRGGTGPGRSGRPGLQLDVRDEGVGFDPSILASDEGLGLAGIREQAEVLGGSFAIFSAPGKGTALHVWWPLRDGATGA
jgi:signal transduction histidine kinase